MFTPALRELRYSRAAGFAFEARIFYTNPANVVGSGGKSGWVCGFREGSRRRRHALRRSGRVHTAGVTRCVAEGGFTPQASRVALLREGSHRRRHALRR